MSTKHATTKTAVIAEGTRVRLLVNDAFLRQYTCGVQDAQGVVLSVSDTVNEGFYVQFDGDSIDAGVWVGADEIVALDESADTLS